MQTMTGDAIQHMFEQSKATELRLQQQNDNLRGVNALCLSKVREVKVLLEDFQKLSGMSIEDYITLRSTT